jgi:hypothetical protein
LKRRQDAGEVSVQITVRQLERYSRAHAWPARAHAFDCEQAAIRRETLLQEMRAAAEEDARLYGQVSRGSMAIIALALDALLDKKTQKLTRHIAPRDILALAQGAATTARLYREELSLVAPELWASTGTRDLERLLQRADPQQRARALEAMHVLKDVYHDVLGDD